MSIVEYNPTASRDARDAAIAEVAAGANPDWKSYMLTAVELVASSQATLTADDVFAIYDSDPHAPETGDNRAFGPVMLAAVRRGFIEKTNDFIPCIRKHMHAQPQRVWRSRIFFG